MECPVCGKKIKKWKKLMDDGVYRLTCFCGKHTFKFKKKKKKKQEQREVEQTEREKE